MNMRGRNVAASGKSGHQTESQVMNDEGQRNEAEGALSILLPPKSMMKDSVEVYVDTGNLG